MSMMTTSKYGMSGAAADLGLGNLLTDQLAAQEEERKRKLKGAEPQQSLFSASAMDLLGKTGGIAGV